MFVPRAVSLRYRWPVVTQPIKGTSPRFSDPQQDQHSAETLTRSIKDRAENIMIVDLSAQRSE